MIIKSCALSSVVEQRFYTAKVGGSNPSGRTNTKTPDSTIGCFCILCTRPEGFEPRAAGLAESPKVSSLSRGERQIPQGLMICDHKYLSIPKVSSATRREEQIPQGDSSSFFCYHSFMLDILFENQDILILNKPAGIMVHGDGKSAEQTLVDYVLEKYPTIKGVGDPATFDGEPIERSGVVHRLDKETSGVIMFAKTQASFEYLKQQFKDRQVQKEYHAFVWGHFKEEKGFVDEPIGRNKNDFRKWTAGRGMRGETREAYTNWEVMQSFEDEKKEKFSLMKLFPKTGRTHQLRVHMKYLQRPIVSDHTYAPSFPDALGFGRVALHAKKVSLLGLSGESIGIEAPYPADFAAALARYTDL